MIDNPLGGPVFFRAETDSTMTDALEAARKGAPAGTLCWTSYQKAGRGRLPGRQWESSPGDSLMFTMLLQADTLKLQPSLSLRMGLAVAQVLEELHIPDIRIKWPNDVYGSAKKLCGILCEYRSGFVLAGIGLNLMQKSFPEDLPQAGSLYMVHPQDWDAEDLLTRILHKVPGVLESSISLEQWNRRLLWMGEEVEMLEGDPARKVKKRGRVAGIAPDGALLMDFPLSEGGRKAIYSGELSF